MYNEFYRFSENPFEDIPDPKFLYLTPYFVKALNSLLAWVKGDNGIVVITGEAGTGKTLLAHILLSYLDERTKTILLPNPILPFKELLIEIFSELNLPIQEETGTVLLHRLMRYLNQIKSKGETLLIVLDEAQGLSDQVLEEIQSFFTLRSKPTQIILLGQPHIESILSSPGLRKLSQEIKIRLQIPPFTGVESQGYIHHRLRLVGSHLTPFTPKAISLICHNTQGIPRLINHVCDNALRAGCAANKKSVDVDIIQKVIHNLEGPMPDKKTLLPIQAAHWVWTSLGPSSPSLKRLSMAILLLVCLGGLFFFLHDYLLPGPMKMGEIKPFEKFKSVMESYEDLPLIPPHKRETETVTVKRGQNLSLLAKQHFNMANATDMTIPTLVDLILELNPEITNAHRIGVDQLIKIPKITEDIFIIQSPDKTFKIHFGTFWGRNSPEPYYDGSVIRNKTIEIIPRKISPTESWSRILIGNFDSRDEALKMISYLKEKGLLPSLAESSETDLD